MDTKIIYRVTLWVFKEPDLIEVSHYTDFTNATIRILDLIGHANYKAWEKSYNKTGVGIANGYVTLITNYTSEVTYGTN